MKKTLLILGFLGFFTQTIQATTVATINNIKISQKEADKALHALTKGKMTWDTLPDDGKIQLIQMLAPSKLVAQAAKKRLGRKEKADALSNFWMQKKMSKTKVSDKEAKKAYRKMKKLARKSKRKQKLPSFEKAKNGIKMQLAQEKIVSKLLKKTKIRLR